MNQREKFWKYEYIHSTQILEFHHNLLHVAHLKAFNNCEDYY